MRQYRYLCIIILMRIKISLSDIYIFSPEIGISYKQVKNSSNIIINTKCASEIDCVVSCSKQSNCSTVILNKIKQEYYLMNYFLPDSYYLDRSSSIITYFRYGLNQRPISVIKYTTGLNVVLILKNNKIAGCGSADVNVWDIYSGKLLQTLSGYSQRVYSLAELDNNELAGSSFDSQIIIWDLITSQIKRLLIGHSNLIFEMVVLRNGLLVSASYDKTLKKWNTTSSKLVRNITVHTSSVRNVVELPSGLVASGSFDFTIKIWNPNNGIVSFILRNHTDALQSLFVMSNGYLASGSADCSIKLWNTTSGSLVFTLNGHTSKVLALNELNGYLVSGSLDKTLKIWNVATGELVKSIDLNYVIYSIALTKEKYLVVGSHLKGLLLF